MLSLFTLVGISNSWAGFEESKFFNSISILDFVISSIEKVQLLRKQPSVVCFDDF